MNSPLILVTLVVFFFFATPFYAHAYLDGGTITFVIQSVVAVFVGVALYVKFYWFKLKNLFIKNVKKSSQKDESQPTQQYDNKRPQED